MSPKLPHACEDMRRAHEDPRTPLIYAPRVREYGIKIEDSWAKRTLEYCPWCGQRLPASLRDEWCERIFALGHEIIDEDIPAPYDSDEWWRDDTKFSHGERP